MYSGEIAVPPGGGGIVYSIKHAEKNCAVFDKIQKTQDTTEEVDLNQCHGHLKN
jgi:hypothetical protein